MTRLVVHNEKHPIEIKVGNESKVICRCGLSSTQPYCNGTHKKTLDEQEGKVYAYDDQGNRVEVKTN